MYIIANQSTIAALKADSDPIATHRNQDGQLITFYEHPVFGEDAPICASIMGVYFNTNFHELDDMTASHGEYTPILRDGAIILGYQA